MPGRVLLSPRPSRLRTPLFRSAEWKLSVRCAGRMILNHLWRVVAHRVPRKIESASQVMTNRARNVPLPSAVTEASNADAMIVAAADVIGASVTVAGKTVVIDRAVIKGAVTNHTASKDAAPRAVAAMIVVPRADDLRNQLPTSRAVIEKLNHDRRNLVLSHPAAMNRVARTHAVADATKGARAVRAMRSATRVVRKANAMNPALPFPTPRVRPNRGVIAMTKTMIWTIFARRFARPNVRANRRWIQPKPRVNCGMTKNRRSAAVTMCLGSLMKKLAGRRSSSGIPNRLTMN